MTKKHGKKDLIEILNRRKNRKGIFRVPVYSGKKIPKRGVMIDYIIHQESGNPNKYFVIELKKTVWNKELVLRIGYYVLGRMKSVVGKWRWGQSAPLITIKDMGAIFKKANTLLKRNKLMRCSR